MRDLGAMPCLRAADARLRARRRRRRARSRRRAARSSPRSSSRRPRRSARRAAERVDHAALDVARRAGDDVHDDDDAERIVRASRRDRDASAQEIRGAGGAPRVRARWRGDVASDELAVGRESASRRSSSPSSGRAVESSRIESITLRGIDVDRGAHARALVHELDCASAKCPLASASAMALRTSAGVTRSPARISRDGRRAARRASDCRRSRRPRPTMRTPQERAQIRRRRDVGRGRRRGRRRRRREDRDLLVGDGGADAAARAWAWGSAQAGPPAHRRPAPSPAAGRERARAAQAVISPTSCRGHHSGTRARRGFDSTFPPPVSDPASGRRAGRRGSRAFRAPSSPGARGSRCSSSSRRHRGRPRGDGRAGRHASW